MSSYVTIIDDFNGKGLSATQKIALALIHGFSQNRQGAFTGDIDYISWWLGASNRSTIRVLKKLEEMGLIEKLPSPEDKRRSIYRVTEAATGYASPYSEKIDDTDVTNLDKIGDKSDTNLGKICNKTSPISENEDKIDDNLSPKYVTKSTKIGDNLSSIPIYNTIDNNINNTIHSSNILAQKNEVSETTPISSKIEALQQAFSESLTPFRDRYPVEMLEAFSDYWAAPLQNPKPSQVKAGILLKYQTQETWSLAGRLRTWAKRDSTYQAYQGQYSRTPDGPRVNSRGETRMVESYRKANEAFNALLNQDNNQTDQQ